MHLKIIETQDGSRSLFDEDLQEAYHSVFGAYTEAMQVYINNGLNLSLQNFNKTLRILEVSFGTGLHSYLTLCEAHKQKRNIHITTVDYNPPANELILNIGYEMYGDAETMPLFKDLTEAPWGVATNLSKYFSITKLKQDVQQFSSTEKYHLVYYSGFSYQSTPLVWEKQVLENIYQHMLPNSFLVSHVAKGMFKRTLKEIGFSIEALPGANGKRECIRAMKK
jgi:tRNA U34 5-methylaminomethyl-2-thiouridine-forming methyltransferase MnmC